MTRRKFIESLGATCRNWRWSWSFVNHNKKWVIFGAWKDRERPDGALILADDWAIRRGRKNSAYYEGLDYLALVKSGYALFTFPMERLPGTGGEDRGPASIKSFEPKILQQKLRRAEGVWLAVDGNFDELPDQVSQAAYSKASFLEGGTKKILVNAYERDPNARAMCIAHHGYVCAACGLSLEEKYGEVARNRIHVHHLVRVSDMGEGYCVDPVADLVPICPNCHAVIHWHDPMLTLDELRKALSVAE